MRRAFLLVSLCCLCGAARGSLDGLCDALVERARPALKDPRTLDVAVMVTAPSPRLASDVAALVGARLRALGVRSASPTLDGGGFERQLRVRISTENGRLRAEGEVLAVASATWAPEPRVVAHLFAEAPLDAELRAYLPPSGPAAWQARGFPVGDVPLLALAVGVVDGRATIVGATSTEVIGWALDGERLSERFRVALAGPPAAIRPRADVAVVAVDHDVVIARSSRFSSGVRWSHGTARPQSGWPNGCELVAGIDQMSCPAIPEPVWTTASLGGAHPAQAAVLPPGNLWLQLVAGAAPSTLPGVGAEVALASLERGDVVATTEPSEPGEPDAIVLRALGANAPVLHRVPVKGSVRALASGDADGDGRSEIVAAVRDDAARRTELWLVR